MFSNSRYNFFLILLASLLLLNYSPAHSQTNISGIVNAYTPVTHISSCTIDVSDASAFSVGNRVMIIQMKGATVDTTSNTANFGDVLNLNTCGNYEFGHVSLIVGNTIFLTVSLIRSYNVTGIVQLIKVPQYTDATIIAPITCPNWNGSVGGIVVIECSGTLTFNDSTNVIGKGFVLGNVSPTGYSCPGSFDYYYSSTSYFGAEKGEGISVLSPSKQNGMGKRANGGGGGNNVNAGGGGGANFGKGGNGGDSWEGCPIMDIGGRGGQSLSYSNLLNKVFLGGGGGGGQQNDHQATPGTNGGGIVIVRANSINGNGYAINANTFNVLPGGCDGTGGGGAGGSVLLDVNNFNGILKVNAKGGDGSFPTCYAQGASGGGGGGCIWSKTGLPGNVLTNVVGGIRGIHGAGSLNGLAGDTLSGLTIVGSPFTFYPTPPAVPSPNDTICFGTTATLGVTPNGAGYTYSWTPAISLSDSTIYNPVAAPVITTIYSVILTYPTGCRSSAMVTVAVIPAPVAAFSSNNVCHGNATQFADSSTTSSGTISTRIWNFGDGSPVSSLQNPSHIYSNAGNYNVTLIVNNSFGCADTITKPVHVYFNATVGFTHNNVCHGDTIHFSNTSSVDPSTSIATYLWIFGDGSATSNFKNPVHYYAIGAYTVTLVVTTADGCSGVANNTVKTFGPPTSAFTFSHSCLLDSATFTNVSTGPTIGSMATWSWNFGDGSPLSTAVWSPSHQYNAPGNYQVSLITHSSNLGCADTLQSTITVYHLPVANFGFTNVCLHQPMSFHDSSLIATDTLSSWSWNFGDTTPSVGIQNPSHTYTSSGPYNVSLIVLTNHGCKDTATKGIIVHSLPDAQFSSSNACEGSIIQFSDLSNIASTDTIQSQIWNFDDGSPLNANQNPSHLYANAGSYSVKLVVVSKFGCHDSIIKTSIVYPNPIVNFASLNKTGCETLCVNFQDSSSISIGNNMQWLWSFGDGNNGSEPNHCYTNDSVYSPQYFNITLTVTSDSGCVGVKTKNNYVTVYPNPNAVFSVQPATTTIIDPVISITDLSAGTNFWNWNFGDHDTTSKHHPGPHTFPDIGKYTITLVTSTLYGCLDTAYQTITVEPDFEFFIPNSFSPNEDGINDTFSGKGVFINAYEMTIFDRWGNLIFFSDDFTKPWDGKANHGTELAQEDVYVYSIKVTDINKITRRYRGKVTLVR